MSTLVAMCKIMLVTNENDPKQFKKNIAPITTGYSAKELSYDYTTWGFHISILASNIKGNVAPEVALFRKNCVDETVFEETMQFVLERPDMHHNTWVSQYLNRHEAYLASKKYALMFL